MNATRTETSVNTREAAIDTLARSLGGRFTRRRAVGMIAATLAGGLFGTTRHRDAEAAATSIPPNCIYVCCDGTCDSWKMCMRCVQWPKSTTVTTTAVR